MDRFKNMALGAVTVLVLVMVVGLAAIGGAVATAVIADEVSEADKEVEASKAAAAAEAKLIEKMKAVEALEAELIEKMKAVEAKTPATTQVSATASQSGSSQSGIWVSGEGSVTLEPDLATLGLGVEARGETVSDAIAEASTAMDAVLGALRGQGIQDRDVQTRNFNVWPEYEYQEVMQDGAMRRTRVLVGYVVSNTVTAKIRDLDSVGEVIDEVAAAGGDSTRIDSVGFTVDDQSAYAEELRSKAVADAMEKASHYASLAGVSLGEVTFISEAAADAPIGPVFRESAAFAMAAAPATSISGGEVELRMSVQVLFEIE